MDTINKKFYLPLVESFYENTKDLYEKSQYPYGPFVPYVFSNYYEAPSKIFFCGLETYGWVKEESVNGFLKCGRENRLSDYLDENSKVVSPEFTLEWGNRFGSFWPFANRLQLLFRDLPHFCCKISHVISLHY